MIDPEELGRSKSKKIVAGDAFKTDLTVSDAKVAAKNVGGAYLNGEIIKGLSRLGVEADSAGLVSVATGGLITTMEGLAELQAMVLDVARGAKPKTVLDAALTYSLLAKAMQGCASAVKADGLASGRKPGGRKAKTLNLVPPPIQQAV